jgi:stalled ribosome rescue protein Dom34
MEIISGKSEEGAQISSLGKVGAILRFRPSGDQSFASNY